MNFNLHQITPTNFNKVLELFKAAAEKIAKQQIDHWQYWKNPPIEKVNWVKEGIANNEFFFIKNTNQDLIGMVRILTNDTLYWGKTKDKAYYVHSLVVIEKYKGQGIGTKVLQQIAREAKAKNFTYLRLDCDANNPKLCAYYEKQGFVKVGEKILPLSTYNLYQKEV